jgi:hypothetical protein
MDLATLWKQSDARSALRPDPLLRKNPGNEADHGKRVVAGLVPSR